MFPSHAPRVSREILSAFGEPEYQMQEKCLAKKAMADLSGSEIGVELKQLSSYMVRWNWWKAMVVGGSDLCGKPFQPQSLADRGTGGKCSQQIANDLKAVS